MLSLRGGYVFNKGIVTKYYMESKHLIIAGIWAAVIIIIIGFFITGTKTEFLGYLILLFTAFIFSLITEFLLTKK